MRAESYLSELQFFSKMSLNRFCETNKSYIFAGQKIKT